MENDVTGQLPTKEQVSSKTKVVGPFLINLL